MWQIQIHIPNSLALHYSRNFVSMKIYRFSTPVQFGKSIKQSVSCHFIQEEGKRTAAASLLQREAGANLVLVCMLFVDSLPRGRRMGGIRHLFSNIDVWKTEKLFISNFNYSILKWSAFFQFFRLNISLVTL